MAGYNLQVQTTSYGNLDNHDWLASSHGTDATDSITLDAASALAAFADGVVPAGVEVSRDTATGRYMMGWAATGRDRPGFLLHSVTVTSGVHTAGALLWHGEVIADRVPLGTGGTAPAQANHPQIRLV